MKQKEVWILFKTHLDIGYTDFSERIIEKYVTDYLPHAIETGYALKDTDTPYIWSVGSFLIDKALRMPGKERVEKAIRDGIICWHALPFTSHTELMNGALLDYALGISAKLDKRFGKKTTGAKMTDVPGHTVGMVKYMAKHGVTFLHIGTNTAAATVDVPPLFRWKWGKDELRVMYAGTYGGVMDLGDVVIYFSHANDNSRPQTADEVKALYAKLHEEYPGYAIKSVTLSDVADYVGTLENLPVIEKELGDTWIHGAATDPKKLATYRRLLREVKAFPDNDALTDSLLLVPEHTWGLCVFNAFHNMQAYGYKELEQCVDERKLIEASWQEQRDYVLRADDILGLPHDYPSVKPDLSANIPVKDDGNVPVEISFELYDNADYARYAKEYLRLTDENRDWALWDNTRIGLPDYKGGIFTASVAACYQKEEEKLYKLAFASDAAEKYGLPYLFVSVTGSRVTVTWFGKKASRLPQAFWLKFKNMTEDWELNKVDEWIHPSDIIGSPLITAVNEGVRNPSVCIKPLDSALVAPYGRHLLRYGIERGKQDLYFNLYNNIWNTNFPLWYDDDSVFRFDIEKR